MRRSLTGLSLALSLIAAPAFAQGSAPQQKPTTKTLKPPAKPKVPRKPLGFRVFGVFDLERAAAAQSFETVTGSSWLFGFGGGLDVLNVWRDLYIRGGFSMARTSGERVLVVGDEIIFTGFPLAISRQTIEIGGGWRFAMKNPKVAIYLGGGLLLLNHAETSDFAQGDENVHENAGGYFAMGSVEYMMTRAWFFGVEGAYRAVPGVAGRNGASAQYGEDNLGGIVARVMIGYRIK